MLESNNTNLFNATVVDHGSIVSMENFGGCISITSAKEPTSYDTVLQIVGEVIIDTHHPKRVINGEIKVPAESMPITSDNGHLYTVVENSLVKCNDNSSAKSLNKSLNPFKK